LSEIREARLQKANSLQSKGFASYAENFIISHTTQFLSQKFNYLENFENVYKIFRSLINIGAQSSNHKRKTVKELKEIQKFWPKTYNNTVNLSWEIDIQIIRKL